MLPEDPSVVPETSIPEATSETTVDGFGVAPPPPVPAKDPFWGYSDVLLFVGVLFACFMVMALVLAFAGATGKHPSPMLVLGANCLMYVAIYVSFLAIFAGRYHRPVFRSLGWRVVSIKTVGASFAGAILLTIFVQVVGNLLHTPKIETPMDEYLSTTPRLLAFGIMAVTLAPIFEELVFRGFLQPLFCRSLGVLAGILVTAILFGALHASEYHLVWQYVAVVSMVGLALGWVRWRANSLLPSTVMHASYNAMLVIAAGYSHFHKPHVI